MNGTPQTPLRERETSGLTRDRLALEARRSIRPLLILLVGIVAALVAGAILLKNLDASMPFSDSYEFRVAVDDAKGVVPGQHDVRLAGVAVGQIKAVELIEGQPVMLVSIDPRYAPLRRDARLRLRPKTPLQDLYLNIETRGSPRAAPLEEGETMAAERTRTPVDISRVLNVFDPPTADRFERMIDEFARGLGDDGDQLRQTFVELVPFLNAAQRLSRETAIRRDVTRRLVHNFRLMVDELGRRDEQVSGLVAGGSTTFAAIRRAEEPLDRTLAELPPTLSQLQGTMENLDEALDEVDPALVAFRRPARLLDPALHALARLSEDARPGFRSLRRVTRRLLPLAQVTVPLARDLELALRNLRRSAPRLDRSTQAIVPCMLPVQKFFHWSASIGKFSDANAVYPRGEAVSYSPSNPPRLAPSCAQGGPPE